MWLSGRQQSQRSLGLDADVEGGADGAPEEVAVGEADRVRGAGAAAGEDAGADLVHVVLAEQRQVGLGLGQLAGVVEVDDRLLGGDDRGPLARGSAAGSAAAAWRRPSSARGPAPPARGAGAWSGPRSSRGGRRGRRGGGRPRSPPPRARRRSSRRRPRPGRCGRGSSGISGPASRRASSAGYRAHHAQTPQGRPARAGSLRADRVAAAPASTTTSATRRPTGSPRSRSTGPRCSTPSGRRR